MKKLGFSSVSRDHLLNLGVEGKDLVVKKDVLEQRLRSNTGCEHKIKLLCAQLKRIFRFVSMRVRDQRFFHILLLLAGPSLNQVPE